MLTSGGSWHLTLFKTHESQVVKENKKVAGEAMTMEETGNTQTVLKQTKAVRRSLDYLISLLHSRRGVGGIFYLSWYRHLLLYIAHLTVTESSPRNKSTIKLRLTCLISLKLP